MCLSHLGRGPLQQSCAEVQTVTTVDALQVECVRMCSYLYRRHHHVHGEHPRPSVCCTTLQVRDPDSKQFLMFYEAVAADGSRSIGLATSADGRSSWQRMPQPVLAAADAEQAWDAGSVGCPCVVPMSAGRWRLYYAGRASQHGPWEGIGVALGGAGGSSGCLLSFKRRTGAQQ